MPETKDAKIKVNPNGHNVFCSMGANPKTVTTFTLTSWPLPTGAETTIRKNATVDPSERISLGTPSTLIGKVIIQSVGRILKNPGSNDDTYFAELRFYQGSERIGEARISGTFGNKNSARFEINCALE